MKNANDKDDVRPPRSPRVDDDNRNGGNDHDDDVEDKAADDDDEDDDDNDDDNDDNEQQSTPPDGRLPIGEKVFCSLEFLSPFFPVCNLYCGS